MEKPNQKEMREETLHLLKTNPNASYSINEIIEELSYSNTWKPTLAKIVSTLKSEGIVVGEKHEGDLVMSYSIHELELASLATEPAQPEPTILSESTHEYHLSKPATADPDKIYPHEDSILLHEGFGTLRGAISIAETLAQQEMCDIIIQRIETITVGTVKTTIQTQFQPTQRN